MRTQITEEDEGLRVVGNGRPIASDVKTMPYPGFCRYAAQIMAYYTAKGISMVIETVFENVSCTAKS